MQKSAVPGQAAFFPLRGLAFQHALWCAALSQLKLCCPSGLLPHDVCLAVTVVRCFIVCVVLGIVNEGRLLSLLLLGLPYKQAMQYNIML